MNPPPLSPHICMGMFFFFESANLICIQKKKRLPHGIGSIPQWEAATILKLHFEKCAKFSLTC
jgi:hypothetical protein